ncbi:MAG: 4'-phosphopantetheinyl transferase superfamily protein [Firmicutes bacterium]|nr:4'-phosphopantetheinyl transferase superfamily protein [Bacillota bacterium]
MIFNVYIYEGTTSSEELSHSLARDAVIYYCREKGISFDDEKHKWAEGEKGKPYFTDLPVHFNVSHSGMLWVCMVGDAPCGIDIQVGQEMNIRKYDKIMQRYFTLNEQAFCDKYGTEGFFRIWAHREAYGKFTGEGFYGRMPEFVGDDGFLNIEVEVPGTGEKVYIKDEPIGPDIYLAYCSYGEDDYVRFVE